MVTILNAIDFEYDGVHARDYGLVICKINSSSSSESLSIGADINFNRVSSQHGNIQYITDVSYDDVLETTFQVCKYDCKTSKASPFTVEELRDITRWLNRDEDHILKMIGRNDIYDNVCYEGTFNIKKIEINGEVIGLELYFTSNRPFALENLRRISIKANSENYEFRFNDTSDKVGYIYPTIMKIKLPDVLAQEKVDVRILNSLENRETVIKNCSAGEIITFKDVLFIETSLDSHKKLQNDFNYTFFRIANTYKNKVNKITISTPCEIYFEYFPIVKGVGI